MPGFTIIDFLIFLARDPMLVRRQGEHLRPGVVTDHGLPPLPATEHSAAIVTAPIFPIYLNLIL
jgi:hypothetical protein